MFTFEYVDEEGNEQELELPTKREVCSRCKGYGTHLNPSIGEYAYTREEFEDAFDHDEREQYFKRGGIYDVTCEECRGQRVVDVVDEHACQTGGPKLRAALQKYHEVLRERAELDRIITSEVRNGA